MKQRPVNLDLTTIKLPVNALASILHRVAGIVIFLSLPFLMYLLQLSLSSQAGFQQTLTLIANPFAKLTLFGVLAAGSYHLIAGIRHMIMDLGFGETIQTAQRTAKITIILAVLVTISIGCWLW